tara:strand:- start:134 stop:274 length:141 start_codon:yes stop_codon:yes gene_type:complete
MFVVLGCGHHPALRQVHAATLADDRAIAVNAIYPLPLWREDDRSGL